ncbi:sugar transporter [Novosphingobium sp. FSY-8]|uniref:Sugar transporter n=1 Tax=Novosphingobium ovatum TaxID=1908523 RepID=A0ABW9X9Y3_9SPHN|nr:sugar transporter [Novosphingobium ovatum]NBC35337.1 sugar transporter [Novosphingobium ovatum]
MSPQPNRRHRAITIAFLAWNALGVAAFAMQSTADPATLAAGDPVTARIWAAMPVWAWGAYALATLGGLTGAVALALGRGRLALAASAAGVLGVLVQFGWSLLATDLLAAKGMGAAVFPAIILTLAVAQTWYAAHRLRAAS